MKKLFFKFVGFVAIVFSVLFPSSFRAQTVRDTVIALKPKAVQAGVDLNTYSSVGNGIRLMKVASLIQSTQNASGNSTAGWLADVDGLLSILVSDLAPYGGGRVNEWQYALFNLYAHPVQKTFTAGNLVDLDNAVNTFVGGNGYKVISQSLQVDSGTFYSTIMYQP